MLQRDTAAAVEEAAQSENISLEGLRVLLAEDMEINAELVSDLLGLEGVEVEWAKNGLQAVNLFEQSKPEYYDAILMDIRMPVMDGLISTRTIRSLSRPDAASVPIIALTANAFEEDVEQALSAGMNVHLSKPVDPDLLYRTLGRLAVKR
jgi:CheY-like chemotaxis protein